MNLSKTQPENRIRPNCLCLLVLCLAVPFATPVASVSAQDSVVNVTEATMGDLTHSVELPATVKAWQSADLFGKVGGYLKEVNVDIGDRIKKGQVVAVVDVPELQAELIQRTAYVELANAEEKQAAAAVVQARAILSSHEAMVSEAETGLQQKKALFQYEQADFERIQSLVTRGAVDRELLDAATYKVASATAEIEGAKAHVATVNAELASKDAAILRAQADQESANAQIAVAEANREVTKEMIKYAQIKAPFDGVVTKRWFDPGAFIQSAEGNSAARPILQVVQIDKVRISIMVSMSQVSMLDVGDPVVFQDIDGLEGKTFSGAISRMSAGVDEKSRMMEAEVDIDNANDSLMPGYFGYARIALVSATNQVLVPASAIVCADVDFVLVVNGGKAIKKAVAVFESDGKLAAIASGVSKGDKVIANPKGITDGQSVTIK